MAVTITSKFYQNSLWKDIAKIVFTSPNMDSPAVAGTRSHILPGAGALGLWYEDSSMIYRIEALQEVTVSDYFNYKMVCSDTIDLSDTSKNYIDITEVNDLTIEPFVKTEAMVGTTGYELCNHRVVSTTLTPSYAVSSISKVSHIFDTVSGSFSSRSGGYQIVIDDKFYSYPGWYADYISTAPVCEIVFEFDAPLQLGKVELNAVGYENVKTTTYLNSGDLIDDSCGYQYGSGAGSASNIITSGWGPTTTSKTYTTDVYYPGTFTISGSNNNSSWSSVLAAQTVSTMGVKSFTVNSFTGYKYLKINITGTAKRGIGGLKLYTYSYDTGPGDKGLYIYEYSDEDDIRELTVNNIIPIEGTTYTDNITEVTQEISGGVAYLTMSGINFYNVFLASAVDINNYMTLAACTISGATILDDTTSTTYLKSEDANMPVLTSIDVVGETLTLTASGSKNIIVNNYAEAGTAELSYITTATGTHNTEYNYYPMTGHTIRRYSSHLKNRRESYRLVVDEYITSSGIISAGSPLIMWGFYEAPDMEVNNSIVFEVTVGEAYNCRLTAWDDATHSTTLNELIQGDHARCSAVAYCCKGSKLAPTYSGDEDYPVNLVYPPAHNRIFKGNTFALGEKYYYGDFDLVYRYQADVYGDFLMFKPMLYGIDSSISYGVHDFLITLHYSYT